MSVLVTKEAPDFTAAAVLPDGSISFPLFLVLGKISLARWLEILYIPIHDGSSLSGKGTENPASNQRYSRNDSGDD